MPTLRGPLRPFELASQFDSVGKSRAKLNRRALCPPIELRFRSEGDTIFAESVRKG
jgi:hypothetical protein